MKIKYAIGLLLTTVCLMTGCKQQIVTDDMDDNEKLAYCEICRSCDRECKQSFRIVSIYCPYYEIRHDSEIEEGGE